MQRAPQHFCDSISTTSTLLINTSSNNSNNKQNLCLSSCSNTSTQDSVYGAVLVRLMNVQKCQAAAGPQANPTDLAVSLPLGCCCLLLGIAVLVLLMLAPDTRSIPWHVEGRVCA